LILNYNFRIIFYRDGSDKFSNLPIERVQHIYDPIGSAPVITNLNLVHINSQKEIFLTLASENVDNNFDIKIPSLIDSVYQFFGEYDINGNKLLNLDIDDHAIISYNRNVYNNNNFISSILKFNLKYHSMSKYLEVLRKTQTKI